MMLLHDITADQEEMRRSTGVDFAHEHIHKRLQTEIQNALSEPTIANIIQHILKQLPAKEELYLVGSQIHNHIRILLGHENIVFSRDRDFVTSYQGNLEALFDKTKFPHAAFSKTSFGGTRVYPFGEKDGFSIDIRSTHRADYVEIMRNPRLYTYTMSDVAGSIERSFTPSLDYLGHNIKPGTDNKFIDSLQHPNIRTVLSNFTLSMSKTTYALRIQKIFDLGGIEANIKQVLIPIVQKDLHRKDIIYAAYVAVKTNYIMSRPFVQKIQYNKLGLGPEQHNYLLYRCKNDHALATRATKILKRTNDIEYPIVKTYFDQIRQSVAYVKTRAPNQNP